MSAPLVSSDLICVFVFLGLFLFLFLFRRCGLKRLRYAHLRPAAQAVLQRLPLFGLRLGSETVFHLAGGNVQAPSFSFLLSVFCFLVSRPHQGPGWITEMMRAPTDNGGV
jgi:hypothetical protein